MFFTNKKEPRSSINMKGLCTKFGFAAMCEAVCVWACALLLAFIFLLLATLWWCVCVCCFCSFHPCQIMVGGIKDQRSQS